MTKKHFEAFAAEAQHYRRMAARCAEVKDKKASTALLAMAKGIEDATVKVAQEFSATFDEARFRNACQSINPDR